MYYRDGGGLGCVIGIFIFLLLASVVIAILLNPLFWIVVGLLVLFQAVARWWRDKSGEAGSARRYRSGDSGDSGDNRSSYDRRASAGDLEDDFTKDAVDVDVEVISDDK
ncbi:MULTISPECIES: hypothetical protein [Mogibacterium]|jgi:hypothetical protein|uniref:Uncharacterized protein n=1 Tax=Mogibacterium timidum ATCC 33093 TaxID=1401079 RepID=X8IR03_9FIRM|nr:MULTISPECIES: hypothetical protein [Mogibacterium]EJU20254.1 hypothetical protein HMPREF1152_0163 [Mogibacterium sp. CM50]EUC51476.1 hypothetical protein HMPREF0581_0118 [Mogibacterium timidum ATCC 33093]